MDPYLAMLNRWLEQVKTLVTDVHGFYQKDDDNEQVVAPSRKTNSRHGYSVRFFSPLTLFALKHKYPEAYLALSELAAESGLNEERLMKLSTQLHIDRKLELALRHPELLIDLVKNQHFSLEAILSLDARQLKLLLRENNSPAKQELLDHLPRTIVKINRP